MKDWIDSIKTRTKAQSKYDKENTVGFYMKLNIHTDQDIIPWRGIITILNSAPFSCII